jgi:hypothetical protein
VKEDFVVLRDATFGEAGGEVADLVEERRVGPRARLAIAWFPDQERVLRLVGRPVPEQPRHVLPAHLEGLDIVDRERWAFSHVHSSAVVRVPLAEGGQDRTLRLHRGANRRGMCTHRSVRV